MKIYFIRNIKPAFYLFGIILVFLGLSNCSSDNAETLFQKLDPDETGLDFENTIITDDSTNALLDPYIYNGGGVGIGDLNNDGFQDIVLTGTMTDPKIYLNNGNFVFQEISNFAGFPTDRRVHGVNLVDINSDQLLDIYLSASGPAWSDGDDRRNLLYINNGDSSFTEQAAEWGIDDPGFTTQSAFLDYD
ncbi:MAG: VCBS repeat-containing protein, partial [Balneolaceae bacterium]|nr:VCBS repeat-containing protein [Balneolaceae bacterium]